MDWSAKIDDISLKPLGHNAPGGPWAPPATMHLEVRGHHPLLCTWRSLSTTRYYAPGGPWAPPATMHLEVREHHPLVPLGEVDDPLLGRGLVAQRTLAVVPKHGGGGWGAH
jgi:hypothetical protein